MVKFERVLKDKACKQCGETFAPRKAGAVFCGMKCYLEARTKHKPKPCAYCGKEYKPYSGANSAMSKYCSQTCSGKASFKQVERKCRNCYKDFMFKPSQSAAYVGAGKYCSRACSYEHRTALNKDKPTKDKWGRTSRKADVEWRTAVKEAYDYTCQRCFVRHDIIHAHHKATRGSHPELKYVVSNGIPLCGSCHAWVHHHPKISYEKGWLSRG